MTTPEYIQLRAFARMHGSYLGILWMICFACYIIGMTQPLAGTFGMLATLFSPFFAAKRLWKFRDEVREGEISFRCSMGYYILMFFYASILFAMAQYLYFAFIDDGFIVRQYTSILLTQEAQVMLKAYGLTLKQATDSLNELAETSPIVIALNIMTFNIAVGILLSVPVAALTKRVKTSEQNNEN